MRKYVITFGGDNDRLHEDALRAAIKAAEKVNKAPAHRAWIETVESDNEPLVRAREALARLRAIKL